MNRTNFEHAAYALLMQVVIGLISGDWFAGACFGAAFFLGREHAQQQAKGKGDFEAFKVWEWGTDAKLDLLFPVGVVTFVFLFTLL
jgi:hypothetical protein